MRRTLLVGFSLAGLLLADARTALADPPPPLPMAGRVFPVYPLYPAGWGPIGLAYGYETFVAADWRGYRLTAAPTTVWFPGGSWAKVPHPWAVKVAEHVRNPAAILEPAGAYAAGVSAYWSGDYRQAKEHFTAATRAERDARPWDYLALANWALGDNKAAVEAARHGAALALLYPEDNSELLPALERVQGEPRRRLFATAAEIATPSDARAVLAGGARGVQPGNRESRADR